MPTLLAHLINLGPLITVLPLVIYGLLLVSATFTALWAPTEVRRSGALAVLRALVRHDPTESQ